MHKASIEITARQLVCAPPELIRPAEQLIHQRSMGEWIGDIHWYEKSDLSETRVYQCHGDALVVQEFKQRFMPIALLPGGSR